MSLRKCPGLALQGHATVSLKPGSISKSALADREEALQELRETNEVNKHVIPLPGCVGSCLLLPNIVLPCHNQWLLMHADYGE